MPPESGSSSASPVNAPEHSPNIVRPSLPASPAVAAPAAPSRPALPVAPSGAAAPPVTPPLPTLAVAEAPAPLPELPDEPLLPPAPAKPLPPPQPPTAKRKLPRVAALASAVVLTLLLLAGAYWLGARRHPAPAASHANTNSSVVSLPKDATITAECVDGRGKQYIIPKDIPRGPIYDVYQGKVIAIEYLVGQSELASQSSLFANLLLPSATYDHLTIMPMDPHAGENEAHFHAIAFLIPQAQSAAITCAASSSDSMGGMTMQ